MWLRPVVGAYVLRRAVVFFEAFVSGVRASGAQPRNLQDPAYFLSADPPPSSPPYTRLYYTSSRLVAHTGIVHGEENTHAFIETGITRIIIFLKARDFLDDTRK